MKIFNNLQQACGGMAEQREINIHGKLTVDVHKNSTDRDLLAAAYLTTILQKGTEEHLIQNFNLLKKDQMKCIHKNKTISHEFSF